MHTVWWEAYCVEFWNLYFYKLIYVHAIFLRTCLKQLFSYVSVLSHIFIELFQHRSNWVDNHSHPASIYSFTHGCLLPWDIFGQSCPLFFLLRSSSSGQSWIDRCCSAQSRFKLSGKCFILRKSEILKDLSEARFLTHSGKAVRPGQLWVSGKCSVMTYLSSSGRDKSWGQLTMVKLRRAKRCSKPSGKEPRLGQYIIVKCSREVRCSELEDTEVKLLQFSMDNVRSEHKPWSRPVVW